MTCRPPILSVELRIETDDFMRSYLPDVVVPLLHAQTRETQRGLTSAAVLLGEVDGELVQDVAGVALEGKKKS